MLVNNKIYVGDKEITKAYQGSNVIYEANKAPDENTIFLLHGEDFTDSSKNNVQLNIGNSVSISADGKFGKSIYISNANTMSTTGINAPNNEIFRFGKNDFTIDWWMKLNTSWENQPYSCGIIGQKKNDSANGWVFYKDGYPGSANYPYINARIGGSVNFLSKVTPATGVWEHWALVRKGTTLMWFHNGTKANTRQLNRDLNDTDGIFFIGYSETWGGCMKDFYLDEVRISDIARWTEDFTPPTKPY